MSNVQHFTTPVELAGCNVNRVGYTYTLDSGGWTTSKELSKQLRMWHAVCTEPVQEKQALLYWAGGQGTCTVDSENKADMLEASKPHYKTSKETKVCTGQGDDSPQQKLDGGRGSRKQGLRRIMIKLLQVCIYVYIIFNVTF